MTTPLETSFKARLRNIARLRRLDPQELWQNLVLERFLVRLSQSRFASRFILKGGVLLSTYVKLNRRTQDLDFSLRDANVDPSRLTTMLREIIAIKVDDDFRFDQLMVDPLPHPHMKYPGLRAHMWALFGKTRFPVSVDFAHGDHIHPTKKTIALISGEKGPLFESSITIHCYPPEFIFAEKLEAIIHRGADNSRMKDYHDLLVMMRSIDFPPAQLESIIISVFSHRQTSLKLPISFSDEAIHQFQTLWDRHRNTLPQDNEMPTRFSTVLDTLNDWLVTRMGAPAQ